MHKKNERSFCFFLIFAFVRIFVWLQPWNVSAKPKTEVIFRDEVKKILLVMALHL